MTYREFAEKLLKRNGITYECHNGDFNGDRNGVHWNLNETCSWDNCYQLSLGTGYQANRISIKTAIKKILAL